jgi:hypothetical protein
MIRPKALSRDGGFRDFSDLKPFCSARREYFDTNTKEVLMIKFVNKWMLAAVLATGLTVGLSAQDAVGSWITSHAATKVSDLTVADLTDLAKAESIRRQQTHYVMSASISSFLIPGTGQFKTGDVTGGTLHLLGQLALSGATLWGAYELAPADLKAWGLTMNERHALAESYWIHTPEKIAPAAAVMAGGALLSLAHSVWAAHDARTEAVANVKEGKVVFEAYDPGAGIGLKMKY